MINISLKRVAVRPVGTFPDKNNNCCSDSDFCEPENARMSWDELRRKYHPSQLEMIRSEFK